jgi:ribonuclease HI
MKLIAFTDGGSRGNPGPSACGVVVKNLAGKVLVRHGRYLGETTNNVAEWTGVIDALEHCKQLGATEVDLFMDSELATKQLKGEYRVKDPDIAKRFLEVKNLLHQFDHVSFTHVRREKNKEADALVNKCLDNQSQ